MPDLTPHVFMTRFNLPANRVEQSIFSPEWLTARMELFERYTVPSVRAQAVPGVSWIIYLDQSTPDWLRRRMDELAAELPLYPQYLDRALDDDRIRSHVAAAARRDRGPVMTSNLDNDDGLAGTYVARMRAAIPGTLPAVIYLTEGLILHGQQVYLRTDRGNAFSAVVDDIGERGFRTCWSAVHHELDTLMTAVRVDGEPGWLQVVHGRNVSNRVSGRLAAPSSYRPAFGPLLDGMVDPPLRARAADVLSRPGRAGRDRVVRPAAATLRRLIGAQRYEALNLAVRRRG